jgi:hypothetical protein
MRRDRHHEDYGEVEPSMPLFEHVDRVARRADPFIDSALDPTSDEYRLMSILAKHRGREHPAPLASLRLAMNELTRMEWSERDIKALVERLRLDHHVKIGSRRSEPFGYFLCVDAEDVRVAIEPYTKQILSMLRVMHVFCSRAERLELAGQLRLVLEKGESDG